MIKYFKKSTEIYLFIYLIFFTGMRYQVSRPDINMVAAAILTGLMVSWFLYALVEKKGFILPPHSGVYIIFTLAILTSAVHSVNIPGSIHELFLGGILVAIMLGIINIVDYGYSKASLLNSALIAGLFYNAAKMYQAVAAWINRVDLCSRIIGFNSPNKSAAMAGLILVLALSMFINKKEKLLSGVLIGSSITIIVASGSRGGIIAAAAGIMTVAFITWIHNPRSGLIAAISASPIMALVAIFLTKPPKCINAWTGPITNRYDLWEYALKVFNKYPVVGSGPGTFGYLAAPVFDYSVIAVHAHNIYLNTLAERGAVGIITAAMLIVVIISTLLMDTKNIALKAAGLGALAAYLIHGLVDVPLHEPYIMRYFVVILALALAGPPGVGARQLQ